MKGRIGREDGRATVILIAGPTASGKSRLALELAEASDGVIVNADSMQLYRELRILTARPSAADEARVPHLLYGVWPAGEAGSVALWLDRARAAIDSAQADARTVIVVGGTGLYFRALLEGLAPVPDIPPSIRDEIRALLRAEGARALHGALAAEDPLMASRLKPSDGQRLARALETVRATGRSLADWQLEKPVGGLGGAGGARIRRILLAPPRDELYARCDRRFLTMIADGALAEVEALAALGLDERLPAMKALGVPQLLAHLRGEAPLPRAIEEARTATRRYAKRQMTWFRNQFADWESP